MTPYYQDKFATIFHGDCREVVPAYSSTLAITDPPYNIGYGYDGYADNLETEQYQDLLRLTCRTPSVVIHYTEQLCALAWTLEELPEKIVAWVYNSNTPRQWRGIGWFGIKPDFSLVGQAYKNPTDSRIAARIANGESARLYDWWEIQQVKNVGEEKTEHPCQIPLDVLKRIIGVTPPRSGQLILDPFCGSGTTLLAAKEMGFPSVGIEQSEVYCEIAARRLS